MSSALGFESREIEIRGMLDYPRLDEPLVTLAEMMSSMTSFCQLC